MSKRPLDDSLPGNDVAKMRKVEIQEFKEEHKSEFTEKLAQLNVVENKCDVWARPPVPSVYKNGSNADLIVQVIDMDYVMKDKKFIDTRLFGVNKNGNSVLIHVLNYYPYCFLELPEEFKEEHLEHARKSINELLVDVAKNYGVGQDVTECCTKVEIVKGRSLYGFDNSPCGNFLKVYFIHPRLCSAINNYIDGLSLLPNRDKGGISVFESNIDYEIRFMADIDLVGCGWVELKAKTYKLTPNPGSNSQIEVSVDVKDLIVHDSSDPNWSGVAPLRILSFDIECQGRKGVFPEASQDPVIQIATMVKIEGEDEPFVRNIFCLKDTADIPGAHVISCETEQELLKRWANFFRTVDADVITGYNIQNFDIPYILDRASALKIDNEVNRLGRISTVVTKARDQQLASKQMGARVNKSINMEGRVIFDVLQVILRDYKLRSYTLNSVSYNFLGAQKEDVEHSIISDLQNGDSQTRKRLAVYCLKDAYLPLQLLQKLMSFINYMEMARVTGVPLNFLLSRGQQVKVLSQLIRKTRKMNLLLPVIERQFTDAKYEGATVIEPLRGFYNEPIATLDFASLYPSIMIAHNICYTSLLNSPPSGWVEGEDYVKSPAGNYFASTKHVNGLLPDILKELLAARKSVKGLMKSEKDPFKQMVYNGRQLALKISANSIYGFTGATVGKLPCLEISSSVTAFGRQMIDKTKELVESTYKKGYLDGKCPIDSIVVYGDTDSVMIKFGVKTVAEAMELGAHAAKEISKTFKDPIKLEFEKVYFPYLLINKKRYAGLYYTKPDTYDKLDCKGLETVRRDNAPIVPKVLNECLNKLLVKRDAEGALKHAKKVISDLLMNRVDISMLVISKELTKKDYSSRMAHVELAERMKKRDPGSAPKLGDRVPYVIVSKGKKVPAYEKAEDPLYVLKNDIPIDTEYYLEHQLAKPLARIFDPILGDKAEKMLTQGEHTLKKFVPRCKVGALFNFTKKAYSCLKCKAVLKDNKFPTCDHCRIHEADVYREKVSAYQDAERKYNQLWSECQRCAGTLCEEIICSSRDCPIFYMREKVKVDLKEATVALRRFKL
uniref:DNA polymerase n=1 Tax=Strongyloides papillosus TaxID=174720 RepID=A0A0N5BA09_STREA